VSAMLPLILVALSTVISIALSVQVGALTLAAGLVLVALLAHLQRATRSPWRSQRSDLMTLVGLAAGVALLALLLP
jgi:hypothetical protein